MKRPVRARFESARSPVLRCLQVRAGTRAHSAAACTFRETVHVDGVRSRSVVEAAAGGKTSSTCIECAFNNDYAEGNDIRRGQDNTDVAIAVATSQWLCRMKIFASCFSKVTDKLNAITKI